MKERNDIFIENGYFLFKLKLSFATFVLHLTLMKTINLSG